MTLVSGPLSTVTTTPSAVAQVNISINSPRTRGAGVMTPEVKTVAVTGGSFSSQIAPGPAVLSLLIGGRESAPIPILVDDVESQTLAEVVDAARLATGETQESLAQFVQQVLEARHDVLDAVAGFGQVEEDSLTAIGMEVDRAEDAADRAESAVNSGVGDGSVTLQKLAPDVTAQINSKADLVGGKVPTSQIPEVALTKPFSVASRAALLALDVQEGDIGIITAGADKGSYVLGAGPANVFGSWVQLAVSADAPVSSVNGQTGTVVLNATDVGAAPTSHTHTVAQITDLPTTIQSELDTRVPPLVADTIATEQTIVDAAAAAVQPLAQGAVDAAAAGIKWHKRPLTQGENINDLVAPGLYWADSWTVANSLIGKPTLASAIDRITVEVTANTIGNVAQEWRNFGTPDKPTVILQRDRLSDGTWGAWNPPPVGKHGHLSEDISDKTRWAGTGGAANKVLGLDADGTFNIATSSITAQGHPVNLAFMNSAINAAKAEVDWSTGRVTPAMIGTIDSAPEGWCEVWGASDATELGLPLPNSSMVLTTRFGAAGFQYQVAQEGKNAQVMLRTRGASVWNEWMPFANAIGGESGTSVAPAPASGFKVVPLAVTLGGAAGSKRGTSGSYRVPVQWNAPITRWRLCVSTMNPRTGQSHGADVTLPFVTWGKHSTNGGFDGGSSVIGRDVIVPGNGETVALPWRKSPIPQNAEYIIGFNYTSSVELDGFAGGSWSTTGMPGDISPSTTRDWLTPLNWWVEAETYATTPTIAVVGDSTSVGVGADFQVKDSWLSRYCRDKHALPIHYGASGASTFDFRNPDSYLVTRWQHLARPDAVIWALGANDSIGVNWTVEQVKTRATESMALAKQVLSPNLYLATAKPRNTDDAAQEAGTAEYNQWLLSLPNGARDAFDFAAAIDDGNGDIRPEFNADGVHVNDAGYTAMIGTITRSVTTPPVMYQTI